MGGFAFRSCRGAHLLQQVSADQRPPGMPQTGGGHRVHGGPSPALMAGTQQPGGHPRAMPSTSRQNRVVGVSIPRKAPHGTAAASCLPQPPSGRHQMATSPNDSHWGECLGLVGEVRDARTEHGQQAVVKVGGRLLRGKMLGRHRKS